MLWIPTSHTHIQSTESYTYTYLLADKKWFTGNKNGMLCFVYLGKIQTTVQRPFVVEFVRLREVHQNEGCESVCTKNQVSSFSPYSEYA